MLFQWVSIELIQVNYNIKDRFPVKNRQPHGLAANILLKLRASRCRRSFIVGPIDRLHGGSKSLSYRGSLVKVEACTYDSKEIC